MLPSVFLNMLLIATVALFLMGMPPHEASKILLHGEEQNMMSKNQFLGSLKGQVPPISVPVPNPPTTTGDIPPSTISQKACASVQSSLLRRRLHWAPPHVLVPPSAPNPSSYVPSSTTQRNSPPPHPSMLHEAYYAPPPNPGTYIPASTTSHKNHNTAPLLLHKCPPPVSMPNAGTSIP